MYADTRRIEPWVVAYTGIKITGALQRKSKLVFPQAGRDVWVGLYRDIRVHTQREPCPLFEASRPLGEPLQLGLAFDVEEEDVGLESRVELPILLAHAGEHNPAQGFGSSATNPLQLATGDDIEAATQTTEQLQQGKRRVCLDRETDRGGQGAEGIAKHGNTRLDVVAGVDVERRAVLLGELLEGDPGKLKLLLYVVQGARGWKRRHIAMLSGPPPVWVAGGGATATGRADGPFGMTTQATA